MKPTSQPGIADGRQSDALRRLVLRHRIEAGVALAFVLLGLVMLREVWFNLKLFDYGQVGPGLLPGVIGLAMVILGTILATDQLRKARGAAVRNAFDLDLAAVIPGLRSFARVVAVAVLFAAAISLVTTLGMIAVLAAALLIELIVIERRAPLTSIAVVCALLLFIFLTFKLLLGIELPAGVTGLG